MDPIVQQSEQNQQYKNYGEMKNLILKVKDLEKEKELLSINCESLYTENKTLKVRLIKSNNMKLQEITSNLPKSYLKKFLKDNKYDNIHLEFAGPIMLTTPVKQIYNRLELPQNEQKNMKFRIFNEQQMNLQIEENSLRDTCQHLRSEISRILEEKRQREEELKTVIQQLQINSNTLIDQYQALQRKHMDKVYHNSRLSNCLRNFMQNVNDDLVNQINEQNNTLEYLDGMNNPQFFTEKEISTAEIFLRKMLKKVEDQKQERLKNKFAKVDDKSALKQDAKYIAHRNLMEERYPYRCKVDFDSCMQMYGTILQDGKAISTNQISSAIKKNLKIEEKMLKQTQYAKLDEFFNNNKTFHLKDQEQGEDYESPYDSQESESEQDSEELNSIDLDQDNESYQENDQFDYHKHKNQVEKELYEQNKNQKIREKKLKEEKENKLSDQSSLQNSVLQKQLSARFSLKMVNPDQFKSTDLKNLQFPDDIGKVNKFQSDKKSIQKAQSDNGPKFFQRQSIFVDSRMSLINEMKQNSILKKSNSQDVKSPSVKAKLSIPSKKQITGNSSVNKPFSSKIVLDKKSSQLFGKK